MINQNCIYLGTFVYANFDTRTFTQTSTHAHTINTHMHTQTHTHTYTQKRTYLVTKGEICYALQMCLKTTNFKPTREPSDTLHALVQTIYGEQDKINHMNICFVFGRVSAATLIIVSVVNLKHRS